MVEERDGKTIIHVKVFGLPNPSNNDPGSRADGAVVKEFRHRFPKVFAEKYRTRYEANPSRYGRHRWENVEIRLEPFSGIAVEGVETDLLAIAGGMAPDVLYVNFCKSDNYIQNGFLYPLDEPEDAYLTGFTKEELNFRVNPKIWPVISRKGPDGKKHVWALPYGGTLGKVLLYRKDLFEERKIPFPNDKWTWDDLLAAARKITNPERGIYGIQLGFGQYESWWWVDYLWSAGGDVMVYDEGQDQWRCVFDSPEAAQALDFYVRLSAERWVDNSGKVRRGYAAKEPGLGGKWDRGEVGMVTSYIDEKLFQTINPEVTGLAPLPLGPSGRRGGELNCRMMGLFAGIEEPSVRDAAWEYLSFSNSKDAIAIQTRVMVECGMGRFVNPKYLQMFGYPEIVRLSPKGWAETFQIAMDTGKPEPYGRNSNVAYQMMTFPIQEAEQMERNNRLTEDPQARLQVMQDLLRESCQRANEIMIGMIAPAEKQKRQVVAWVVLAGIVTVFGFVFRRIIRTFTPPTVTGQKRVTWGFRRYSWAYLLILPAVLTILVWGYVPLVRGSFMAFHDCRIMGNSTWVGIDNLANVLFNPDWWQAVYNSLRYSVLIIACTFLPPIVLAVLLQEIPRGKLLFRMVYYLPAVISGIVTILLWRQFYEPSERGVLNALVMKLSVIEFIAIGLVLFVIAFLFARRLWYHRMRWQGGLCVVAGGLLFLAAAGLASPALFHPGEPWTTSLGQLLCRLSSHIPEPYAWLMNPKTSMVACVIPMIWAGIGPGCLIYLAALKGISDDFYEAAELDGATFIDKILFIVFPNLKPLIVINFVGAFIGSWCSEGNILAMTGGAANTEVAGLHIWYTAFTHMKYGPATAMAWMLGTMLIGFTIYQLQILSRLEFKAADWKEA